jgi:hypothetical protein
MRYGFEMVDSAAAPEAHQWKIYAESIASLFSQILRELSPMQ